MTGARGGEAPAALCRGLERRTTSPPASALPARAAQRAASPRAPPRCRGESPLVHARRVGRTLDHGVPLAPEGAHLHLVVVERLAVHPPRDVRPLYPAGAEAVLARLERLDIVRRAEPARAQERERQLHAIGAQVGALLAGYQLPLEDVHLPRGHRPELTQAEARHRVLEDEVREDDDEAGQLRHLPGAL